MIWVLLLAAIWLAVGLLAIACWLLVGWAPADAQPSDRLERLRRVEKAK